MFKPFVEENIFDRIYFVRIESTMNTKKLTAKQAKRIAWQYIHSWASEAARDDTCFFEVQIPGEIYDVDNEQHRAAISKEFKRAQKYIWKRYKNYISPDSVLEAIQRLS